jgi:hypothetical protein
MYSTLSNMNNLDHQRENFLYDFERPNPIVSRGPPRRPIQRGQMPQRVPMPQRWPKTPPVQRRPLPVPNRTINWDKMEPEREPRLFGPHYWYMLHNMSLNYPNNASDIAKKKMRAFVEALPFLLPCRDCSEHAKFFMAKAMRTNAVDHALESKKNLFTFLWRFHNSVNRRLNKPEVSFNDALSMYSPSV